MSISVAALSLFAADCTGQDPVTNLPRVCASSVQLNQIISVVLAIFGAVAVLMIVIAGLKFVTSAGNPKEISKARSTILYAVIGLIVIISAEVLVAFTIGKL